MFHLRKRLGAARVAPAPSFSLAAGRRSPKVGAGNAAEEPTIPIELDILAWGGLLALVHIFAAAHVKTKQYGREWNMGTRDENLPPPAPLVGRLARAQANYFETFPIVAMAILVDHAAGLFDGWTALGAMLWLGARIVYLPLYAAGVPVVRTLSFTVSLVGLLLLLWPALAATF